MSPISAEVWNIFLLLQPQPLFGCKENRNKNSIGRFLHSWQSFHFYKFRFPHSHISTRKSHHECSSGSFCVYATHGAQGGPQLASCIANFGCKYKYVVLFGANQSFWVLTRLTRKTTVMTQANHKRAKIDTNPTPMVDEAHYEPLGTWSTDKLNASRAANPFMMTWVPGQARDKVMNVTHGEGVYLYDDQGKQYLDWTSQAVCANLGHDVPKEVVETAAQQMATLPFVYGGIGTYCTHRFFLYIL
jgi:Aminotransferase class-III